MRLTLHCNQSVLVRETQRATRLPCAITPCTHSARWSCRVHALILTNQGEQGLLESKVKPVDFINWRKSSSIQF